MRSLVVGGPCRRERPDPDCWILRAESEFRAPGRPARRDAVNRVRSEACFTASRYRALIPKRDVGGTYTGRARRIMTSIREIQIESLQPRNNPPQRHFPRSLDKQKPATLTFDLDDGARSRNLTRPSENSRSYKATLSGGAIKIFILRISVRSNRVNKLREHDTVIEINFSPPRSFDIQRLIVH